MKVKDVNLLLSSLDYINKNPDVSETIGTICIATSAALYIIGKRFIDNAKQNRLKSMPL